MASQEERDLQKETNDLLRQQIALLQKRVSIDAEALDYDRSTASILRDQLKQLEGQFYEKQQIRNASNNIAKIQSQTYNLTLAELATSKGRVGLAKDRASVEDSINALLELQTRKFTTNEDLQDAIVGSIKEQIAGAQGFIRELDLIQAQTSLIEGNLTVGALGAISAIVSKIPALSALAAPFEQAREAAAQSLLENQKSNATFDENVGRFRDERGRFVSAANAGASNDISKFGMNMKALRAGFAALKSTIMTTLLPLALIAEAVRSVMQLDKETETLSRTFNITYREAQAMRAEINRASGLMVDVNVSTKDVIESLVEVNKALGTTGKLSSENLATFSKLRELAGFTNEEIIGFNNLSLTTGKTLENVTGELMAQARISSTRQGVALNERDILKEIKDVSAATTLSFGKNPKLIADAVATTKALGLELSKVEAIADSMLNFESSIGAELEAQVLTGRSLNLNAARFAALNNDVAGLAKEINAQIGSSADFANMNRIQQEAIAKSVGMNREELAKTLFVQEQLTGISGDEAKRRQELLDQRIEAVGLEQAQAELAKEGFQGLEQQASMATRLSKVMDKLRDIFVSLVEPLMPVFDIFVSIAQLLGQIIAFIKPVLDGITGIVGVVTGGLNAITGGAVQGGSMQGGSRTGFDNYGFGEMKNESKKTNSLLSELVQQNNKKQQLSPVNLYQIQ